VGSSGAGRSGLNYTLTSLTGFPADTPEVGGACYWHERGKVAGQVSEEEDRRQEVRRGALTLGILVSGNAWTSISTSSTRTEITFDVGRRRGNVFRRGRVGGLGEGGEHAKELKSVGQKLSDASGVPGFPESAHRGVHHIEGDAVERVQTSVTLPAVAWVVGGGEKRARLR